MQLSDLAFYGAEGVIPQQLQYDVYCGDTVFWLDVQLRLSILQASWLTLSKLYSGFFSTRCSTRFFPGSSYILQLTFTHGIPRLSAFFSPFPFLSSLSHPMSKAVCRIRAMYRSQQDRTAARASP